MKFTCINTNENLNCPTNIDEGLTQRFIKLANGFNEGSINPGRHTVTAIKFCTVAQNNVEAQNENFSFHPSGTYNIEAVLRSFKKICALFFMC
jgi:hypothetical protein